MILTDKATSQKKTRQFFLVSNHEMKSYGWELILLFWNKKIKQIRRKKCFCTNILYQTDRNNNETEVSLAIVAFVWLSQAVKSK